MNAIVSIPLGILLVAVTLPLVLELAVVTAAFLLPRRAGRRPNRSSQLRLAALIPAHDEEALIEATIKSLRGADEAIPIVVVAHNCTDRTAAIAQQAGARAVVLDQPGKNGKGFALEHGFRVALDQGADAVLVVDADAEVSANLIKCVRRTLAEGADAVQCRYEIAAPGSASGSGRKAGLSALAVRAFNFVRPAGRSRLGLSAGILGSGFAIRKSVLLKVPYRAVSLVEDLEYHLQLVMDGTRVQFLREASVLSQLPASDAGAASQRARWEGGRFAVAKRWLLPLAGRVARGQWRLIEPLLDLTALPLALAAAILVFALLVCALLPSPGWIAIYAGLALGVMAIHVLAATLAGDNPRRDLRILTMAPLYVAWKLRLVPRLMRNSLAGADWVRTERATERATERISGVQCNQQLQTIEARGSIETQSPAGAEAVSAGGEGAL